MTRIVYKKVLEKYVISEIINNGSDGIQIEFEEPLDAKLIAGKHSGSVKRGIISFKEDAFTNGEILPKLYTGAGITEIEGFIIRYGAVLRISPNDSYIRNLAEHIDKLEKKVAALCCEIASIENQISRKLEF